MNVRLVVCTREEGDPCDLQALRADMNMCGDGGSPFILLKKGV